MRLMGRQQTSKRRGTQLSSTEIDAAKAIGDHRRDERLKNTLNIVKIIAIFAGVLAIPALYVAILWVNWSDQEARTEWLRQGLVAVIAFALGKVNFNFGEKT